MAYILMIKIKLVATFIILLALALALASCGSGSDNSSSGGESASPINSVNFNANVSSINRGDKLILEWSSTNASSCVASGDWSGNRARSGSMVIETYSAGNKTYILNCSGTSKSVSVDIAVTSTSYDYIEKDQIFSGYLFHKKSEKAGCLISIEAELAVHDHTSLYFKSFSSTEMRALTLFDNQNGEYDGLGLRLGSNGNGGPNYSWPISSPDYYPTNKIELGTFPFSNSDDLTIQEYLEDEFVKANANINLEFDSVQGNSESCWGNDIEMSVMAIPSGLFSENGAMFFGSSNDSGSYTFLYLQDKRLEDKNSANLPQESDIFSKVWIWTDIYTSYLSKPNLVIGSNYGIRVDPFGADYPGASNFELSLLSGSKRVQVVNADNVIQYIYPVGAVKYLYVPDESSTQRIYSWFNTSSECFSSYSDNCAVHNPHIMFFTRDKRHVLGFSLGGYFDGDNDTEALMWFGEGGLGRE